MKSMQFYFPLNFKVIGAGLARMVVRAKVKGARNITKCTLKRR